MNPRSAHLILSLPSFPLPVASKAAIMPISLLSRFSSLWDRIAYLPRTRMPVFRARLATTRFQTGSPVCGFIAKAAPSAPPVTSSRMPFTVAMLRGA